MINADHRLQINSGANDATSGCDYSQTRNEIYLGADPNCPDTQYTAAFRFENLPIIQGSQVVSAHLQFTVDGPYTDPLNVTIAAEATADSTPLSTSRQPKDLTPTTNTSAWTITDNWDFNTTKTTPDLAPVIQEIVDQADWQAGNNLTIILDSQSATIRRVYAYEREEEKAAKLIITIQGPNQATATKVVVLNYRPILESQDKVKLYDYYNWQDPQQLTNQLVQDFKTVSDYYVNYQIVNWQDIDDFPVKESGFDFTDESYLDCMAQGNCDAATADYLKILDQFNICDRVNDNQIDELWIWGGPWFGFYESRLAGPDTFWYNSPPLAGTGCQRQLPIMGLNYQRQINEALESFGHRAESALTQAFGGWAQNRTAHDWDKFALVKAQSPNYDYSGCGSIHYAPNSVTDYDWSNQTYVPSTCQDWVNYPDLTEAKQNLNCQAWNCSGYDFHKYWFSHLPRVSGSTASRLNNWWKYILNLKEATAFPDYLPEADNPPPPDPYPSPSPSPSPTPPPTTLNCQDLCRTAPNPTLCLKYCKNR
ncbi:MAG: hypothetical protein UX85_C0003G0135 [Candidatus Beckwithbacteria bacterium GW2011_GWB1_47_15]|uniref:Uncharacterized protein n=1 Tax=Candidatus Beckwithbacteria bacterium GW2011_GWB1_47_15 TaxID=1618371 RepID=A0A0G1RWH5_9BACT|nr:MAG: hypothetical protein UY43_C0001G0329 [Candidatus Beckwithbacteria bacterium GW2011_GWC1_49_16]KKU35246.1 MAG: hypothetical protein UX50_C0005G0069 [Candidatus Beckwithbacteria bacterium GW2011_GWA1_46_30]KKU61476.1 MAG: hypothetical protein UX85_C0003G0135 [Candidatus Beckwithbacteria bacterium GW2011_GWB1_47_15]KKU71680.1 MAG: hypothetical protein UX97_C0004G0003 [Candidatus Beckwithbacteria bacterium GW2011_GWA2_47_25]KKW03778.1 MAG: hypothetical protein UY37_C0004G0071 [Candidatus Be